MGLVVNKLVLSIFCLAIYNSRDFSEHFCMQLPVFLEKIEFFQVKEYGTNLARVSLNSTIKILDTLNDCIFM